MHEEALFRDLRRELEALAHRERGGRIVRARIWIGALSHVSEHRLRDAWPGIVRGGPADGAELDAEASDDPSDPAAGAVVLRSIVVAGSEGPAAAPGRGPG